MLNRSHRAIAAKISGALSLPTHAENLLETGSAYPDSWMDFPHHHGKEDEIIRSVLKARRFWIKEDDECFHELGIALHFIQDKWTTRPRLGDKHSAWEQQISQCEVIDDFHLKMEIENAPIPSKVKSAYADFLERCNKGARASDIKTYDLAFVAAISDRWKKEWPNETPYKWNMGLINGFGAKVVDFVTRRRQTTYSLPSIDLNFAFRISLEVARITCSSLLNETEPILSEDWCNDARLEKILSTFDILTLTPRNGTITCPRCESTMIYTNAQNDRWSCRQCSFKWPYLDF